MVLLRRERCGFTLLELLLAISILTLVITLFYSTYFMVTRTIRTSESRAKVFHRANFLLNKMVLELTSAYASLYTSDAEALDILLVGDDGQIGDHDADSLQFVSTASPLAWNAPGNQVLSRIVYAVEQADDSDLLALVCSQQPFLAAYGEGTSGEWRLDISEFNLQYYDGSDWVGDWDMAQQSALPYAVRIEVTLPDEEGRQWTFSTVADVPVDTVMEEVPAFP